jgi:hypothetical protein
MCAAAFGIASNSYFRTVPYLSHYMDNIFPIITPLVYPVSDKNEKKSLCCGAGAAGSRNIFLAGVGAEATSKCIHFLKLCTISDLGKPRSRSRIILLYWIRSQSRS